MAINVIIDTHLNRAIKSLKAILPFCKHATAYNKIARLIDALVIVRESFDDIDRPAAKELPDA